MKPVVGTIFAASILLLGASSAAAANLIVNGGFEDGVYSSTIGGNTNDSVPNSWTPNAGFDLEPGFNHIATNPHSGSYDLSISNYDYEPLATLSQTFSDVAGKTYTASFYGFDGGANGDANADLNVSVGASDVTFDDTVSSYTLGSFTFVGTGSDTLTIAAQTDPSEWYVDDVSVSVAGVPEPATWTMMLVGVGVIGAGLRRRVARTARSKNDLALTAA